MSGSGEGVFFIVCFRLADFVAGKRATVVDQNLVRGIDTDAVANEAGARIITHHGLESVY